MTAHVDIVPSVVERIKQTMVGLKMPRAIEILDATVRRLERGEVTALEAIDALLAEEFTLRENRRVKTALVMARLSTIKTLAGFDFSFQPSLDKNRIMALAELRFIDRAEVLHLIGPPGTGKSHLSVALGVEAIKAARSVYFTTLADLVGVLAKAEREGSLREKIRFLCRFALLIVDEIGYLPVTPGGGNLFFQLVNARYEKGAMILTSNRGFAEWGEVFGDPVGRLSWTGFFTTRSSSRSKVRVTVCANTPTSCLSPFAQRLSTSLPRSHRSPSGAAAHPKMELLITTTADHTPAKVGNFASPKLGRFHGPLTGLQRHLIINDDLRQFRQAKPSERV
jgi:DNA replication protein DnaC